MQPKLLNVDLKSALSYFYFLKNKISIKIINFVEDIDAYNESALNNLDLPGSFCVRFIYNAKEFYKE